MGACLGGFQCLAVVKNAYEHLCTITVGTRLPFSGTDP